MFAIFVVLSVAIDDSPYSDFYVMLVGDVAGWNGE